MVRGFREVSLGRSGVLQTRFKEEAVKESYTGVNSWDFRPKLPGSQLSCISQCSVWTVVQVSYSGLSSETVVSEDSDGGQWS